MAEKRFRTGKGIFEEGYASETIIDNKTGKTYYNGYAYYQSSKEVCELLNQLIDDNEQLQERNDRQAKQLDSLYYLIETKDWRALTEIIDDFKQCEEQLQKEWGSYCE